MYIKGIPDYSRNGEARDTALFAGLISQDGELRTTQSGKSYASACVRAFNRKDGSAAFMTIKTFSQTLLPLVANLRRGDRVLCAGIVETRVYHDKQYTDMLLDFLLTAEAMSQPLSPSDHPEDSFAQLAERMDSAGLAPLEEEDGELPF